MPPPPDVRRSAPDALSVLNSVFGLPAFRGAQEEIVSHVTDGGNCLVLMPTGGGKSLCYQLPSLLRQGCGIVVSPLIALMRDQVAGLLEAGVKAAVLNSTLSFEEATAVERATARRRPRSALRRAGTVADAALPGPARPRQDRAVCDRRGALRVAMGARFPAGIYRPVRASRSVFPDVPRIALTATADDLTRKEIVERLGLAGAPQLRREFRPPEHPL